MTSTNYRPSFRQTVRLLLGLFGFALGVVLTLRASLGISPWDVLHDGLSIQTPLSFGMAVIAVGLVLLLLSLAAGIKPGPGTVANMLLIGVFADLMLATGLGDGLHDRAIAIRLPLLLAGVAVIGLGSALYIGAQMGAGPRDSLMVAVATRFGVRVGVARAIVEGSALVAGILLGGQVGPGTVLFAVAIGPSVDVSFRLFRMDSAGRTVKQSAVEATY